MNPSLPTVYCGLDISKASLQLDLERRVLDVANTVPERRKLLQRLQRVPAVHVICEATGGYERSIVTDLQNAGLAVSVINPGWVRNFARAQGRLAKTDRIDAAVLTAYGHAFQPAPTPRPHRCKSNWLNWSPVALRLWNWWWPKRTALPCTSSRPCAN